MLHKSVPLDWGAKCSLMQREPKAIYVRDSIVQITIGLNLRVCEGITCLKIDSQVHRRLPLDFAGHASRSVV